MRYRVRLKKLTPERFAGYTLDESDGVGPLCWNGGDSGDLEAVVQELCHLGGFWGEGPPIAAVSKVNTLGGYTFPQKFAEDDLLSCGFVYMN